MKIWMFNPYGPIPGEGWRDYRFTMLGTELAGRGHSVIWWTANFSHHFKRFRSDTWRDLAVSPGFSIRLVPASSYSANISFARLRFEATYLRHLYQRARREPCPNIIVASDPSQLVGYTSVKLAQRLRAPLILDVFDLWPELFTLALPHVLRPLAPLIFSPLYLLRRYNLSKADALTALCDTYLALARSQAPDLPPEATASIFNGIDVAAFRSLMPGAEELRTLSARMGKGPAEVWAIYAGSLGDNYDVRTMLQAAELLKERNHQIKILIAGTGPLQDMVAAHIREHDLRNVAYLGKTEPQALAQRYAMSDIGLCAYGPESTVAMPDKAYDYMAAGLPIVSSLRGELEAFLHRTQAGIQYDAGNAQSLAGALERLAADEALRKAMARSSYAAAMTFERKVQYGRFADLVEYVFARTSETRLGTGPSAFAE